MIHDAERQAAIAQAAQKRSMRGMILMILNRSTGRPTMVRIIEQAVIGAGGTSQETEEHLFYLESKGYLSRQTPAEHKVGGIGDIVMITAAGMDLVEGTSEDPGVVF